MSIQVKGTIEGKSWTQAPFDAPTIGAKLYKATANNLFAGGIDAEGSYVLMMAVNDDGTGNYVGYERLTGRIGDKSGSFVVQHIGIIVGHGIDGTFTVVPGSGTDALQGLRGTGHFLPESEAPGYIFDYDFDR